jgi:hypothetical protein
LEPNSLRHAASWLPAFKQAALGAAKQSKGKSEANSRALLHLRRYRKTASDLVVKHPRFLTAIHT